MNKKLSVTALAIAIGAASSGVQAQDLEERISALEDSPLANTNFEVGGFIKLDAQLTNTTDGDRPTAGVGDDFLVPSTIPTGGSNSQINNDFSAKQSRIFFKTTTDTDIGDVGTYIEMDFQTNSQGDERITNAYSPRLRHAFMTFQDFTIGQTWSTFHDVSVLPENLDFVGPVGTIFERQAQIRYSPGNWDFAIENPQSTLYDPADPENDVDPDANSMPDLVARYNAPLDTGHMSVAVMGREIAHEETIGANSSREKAYGYGVSLSAKMPVGDNGSDLRAQLSGGNAMGRYLALNGFDAAQIEADGEIELIDQVGGFASYRHVWTSQWRSNFTVSHAAADNLDSTLDSRAKSYTSTHANLIYSPVSNLDLGGELIWADKELENGSNGELHRLQFTAKLGF